MATLAIACWPSLRRLIHLRCRKINETFRLVFEMRSAPVDSPKSFQFKPDCHSQLKISNLMISYYRIFHFIRLKDADEESSQNSISRPVLDRGGFVSEVRDVDENYRKHHFRMQSEMENTTSIGKGFRNSFRRFKIDSNLPKSKQN